MWSMLETGHLNFILLNCKKKNPKTRQELLKSGVEISLAEKHKELFVGIFALVIDTIESRNLRSWKDQTFFYGFYNSLIFPTAIAH